MEQIHNLNHLFMVINEEGKYSPQALNINSPQQIYIPQNKLMVIFFVSSSMNTTFQLNSINSHFSSKQNQLTSYFIIDVDRTPDIVKHYGIKKVPFFMLFFKTKTVKTLEANIEDLDNTVISLTKMIQDKHMATIQQHSQLSSYSSSNSNNYQFDNFVSGSGFGAPFNSSRDNEDLFGSNRGGSSSSNFNC
jgi:hypothetical protein